MERRRAAAGCGHAELTLALAAEGHTVVGIDLTPAAVAAAKRAAQERNLTTAGLARRVWVVVAVGLEFA